MRVQRACAPQRSVTCVHITADDTPLGNCCRSLTNSAATKAAPGGAAALRTGLPSRCAFCSLRSLIRCATVARWARSVATVSTKAAILLYSTTLQVSAARVTTSRVLPLLLRWTAALVSSPCACRPGSLRSDLASAALHNFANKPFYPKQKGLRLGTL